MIRPSPTPVRPDDWPDEYVHYTSSLGTVLVKGRGGHTEFPTYETQARAIAESIGFPYYLTEKTPTL